MKLSCSCILGELGPESNAKLFEYFHTYIKYIFSPSEFQDKHPKHACLKYDWGKE